MEIKVSLFIIGFFVIGLAAYYFKYRNELSEYNEFNYSKSDSSFYSVNFENGADSIVKKSETVFKAKELPKGKVNINKADEKEFSKLPGIGVKTAAKIVEHRRNIRAFKNVYQLMDVKGISAAKFKKLKEFIFVE